MEFRKIRNGVLVGFAATLASTVAASATIVTVFDGIAAGRASFDATVVAAGSVVDNDVLTGLVSGVSIVRPDFTITGNGGFTSVYGQYGTMSGESITINPSGGGSNPRTDPMDYFASGLTFTFNAAVNAIGFEVGDWATCCQGPTTDLFISFDGGAPILVASDNMGAGQFPSQDGSGNLVNEIFVAAFDDTGDFTSVSFWGNGIGEVLVAGGDIRYALLDRGTLPPDPSAIPLPAAGWLMMAGLAGIAALRRRKAA